MPDLRSDDGLERWLQGFAMPGPAGAHDATLLAAARLRAEALVDARRAARLLALARLLDVVGLPALSHFALRLSGRDVSLRLVVI